MTAYRGLHTRNVGTVGTTPLEARLALAGLLAENSPGVPRQGLLWQANDPVVTGAADMSYNISANNPVINRAVGEGVYTPSFTGTTNIATIAAPSSGSRYDLLYVKQNDPDKGDTDNNIVVGVIQGVSGSTPSKPYSSVPAGGYVLSEALVNTGATSTNGSGVTITQVWRHTAPRATPIPVRNTTERDEITPFNGLDIVRLDLGGIRARYVSGAWALQAGYQHYETSFAVTPGPAVVTPVGAWGATTTDTTDTTFVNAGTASLLTLSAPGVYAISIVHNIANATGMTRAFCELLNNANSASYGRSNIVPGDDHGVLALPNIHISSPTTFKVVVFQQGCANAAWSGFVRITKVS